MLEPVGEPKVCDDDVPVSIKEEVFELQVPMDDLLLVNVPDAGDELTEQLAGILLLEIPMGQNMVEEFTTRRVLEDDPDILVRLDNVVQPNDVRMFQSLNVERRQKKPPRACQRDRAKRVASDKADSNAP